MNAREKYTKPLQRWVRAYINRVGYDNLLDIHNVHDCSNIATLAEKELGFKIPPRAVFLVLRMCAFADMLRFD